MRSYLIVAVEVRSVYNFCPWEEVTRLHCPTPVKEVNQNDVFGGAHRVDSAILSCVTVC